MTFQAIVHAPSLRQGARLNVADLDQSASQSPQRLRVGAEIEIRLGVCCPDLGRAIVVDYVSRPESAVIAIDGEEITICHRVGEAGVTEPGVRSETWFVA